MSRPRLLDLFCGAGGSAVGYHRAGFEVVGVDLVRQPHYPFEFHQADALSILRSMVDYPSFSGEMWRPGYFQAIHASPPCQAFTSLKSIHGREHPDLLGPTRQRLVELTVPWVIENVPGAPMPSHVQLCGQAFGLAVRRHRWFESNVALWGVPCSHVGKLIGVYGHGQFFWDRGERSWRNIRKPEAEAAMGIAWMNRDELSQAIPPAYTEFIGGYLLAAVQGRAA